MTRSSAGGLRATVVPFHGDAPRHAPPESGARR